MKMICLAAFTTSIAGLWVGDNTGKIAALAFLVIAFVSGVFAIADDRK